MLLRPGIEKPIETKRLMCKFGWESEEWTDWVIALYMTWLYGATTRDLARQLGCDKNTLISMFTRVFGEDAVNPGAKSLLRSLAEDYPDDPLVEDFIRTHILVTEESTGVEVTPYMCVYSDTVVPKYLVRNTYVTHRSKHSLNQLTRAQCRGEAVLNYHESLFGG